MEVMEAETDVELNFACLIHYLLWPSYSLPTALTCSLAQPSCMGTVACTSRKEMEQVRKQRSCLMSFIRAISLPDFTGQKGV